nr:MAG: hypothetical protein [Microviridae sp.]
MKQTTTEETVQGTELTNKETETAEKEVTLPEKEVTLPEKEKRKVQISVKMLKELATDGALLKYFIETINDNPDMKAPIAYQFAKAIKRQIPIEIV